MVARTCRTVPCRSRGRGASMIHACLNGARPPGAHPPIPVTPDELARSAASCVAAGAALVHVHPRDEHGRETLATSHVVAPVTAIKGVTPGLPVSVTTRDGVVSSRQTKLAQVSQ